MTEPTEPPDDDFSLEVGVLNLHAHGEIDSQSAPSISAALGAASGSVNLDLAGVTFVDSSGLRVLVEGHQLLESRGRRLTILNPSTVVERILDLSAIDQYLNIERS